MHPRYNPRRNACASATEVTVFQKKMSQCNGARVKCYLAGMRTVITIAVRDLGDPPKIQSFKCGQGTDEAPMEVFRVVSQIMHPRKESGRQDRGKKFTRCAPYQFDDQRTDMRAVLKQRYDGVTLRQIRDRDGVTDVCWLPESHVRQLRAHALKAALSPTKFLSISSISSIGRNCTITCRPSRVDLSNREGAERRR
jgi:hypothetical protein